MNFGSGEMRDENKVEQLRLEEIQSTLQDDALVSVDDSRVKRIKRKVDLRLSLILALMYVVNQVRRDVPPKYQTWNICSFANRSIAPTCQMRKLDRTLILRF
jgi:hypothetical protein